jgi:multisubunit Na+/H+ antiporter MnhC subunit
MFSGPGGPVYTTGARITVSGGSGYVAPSSAPVVTPAVTAVPVGSGLNISALPQPLTLEHGQSGILSVSVTSERETVHYQWYRSTADSNKNGAAIGGANVASYIPEEITGTTYYYVTAWTDSGLSLTTPAVAVTYTDAAVATAAPTAVPSQTPAVAETTPAPTAAISVQPQQSSNGSRNALILLGIIIVAATAALIFTMVVLRKSDTRGTRNEFEDDEEYEEDDTY